LDVACGSGIVTRRAAALIGETGSAVGIDISPGQIKVARQNSVVLDQHWCEFLLMDAMHLEFVDNTFDVVVAQYPHFPDRAPETEFASTSIIDGLFRDQLAAHFPELNQQQVGNAPGVQPNAQAQLQNELEKAGLVDISLWSYRHTAPFSSAEETFEWESVRNSLYRMNKAELAEDRLEQFQANYLGIVETKITQYGTVRLSTGGLFGTAVKPK
jgi:SAM-dependent methyltransferase